MGCVLSNVTEKYMGVINDPHIIFMLCTDGTNELMRREKNYEINTSNAMNAFFSLFSC